MLNSQFKLGFNSDHLSNFNKRTDKAFELNQTVSNYTDKATPNCVALVWPE